MSKRNGSAKSDRYESKDHLGQGIAQFMRSKRSTSMTSIIVNSAVQNANEQRGSSTVVYQSKLALHSKIKIDYAVLSARGKLQNKFPDKFPSSSWICQCPCGCGTVVKRHIQQPRDRECTHARQAATNSIAPEVHHVLAVLLPMREFLWCHVFMHSQMFWSWL